MKLRILIAATLASFSVVSDELNEGIEVNIKLLMCLDEKIPDSAIKVPEDRSAKSLLLFPSVIKNITKSESSDVSKKQFDLAVKYCATELEAFKVFIEEQTRQLKQN